MYSFRNLHTLHAVNVCISERYAVSIGRKCVPFILNFGEYITHSAYRIQGTVTGRYTILVEMCRAVAVVRKLWKDAEKRLKGHTCEIISYILIFTMLRMLKMFHTNVVSFIPHWHCKFWDVEDFHKCWKAHWNECNVWDIVQANNSSTSKVCLISDSEKLTDWVWQVWERCWKMLTE